MFGKSDNSYSESNFEDAPTCIKNLDESIKNYFLWKISEAGKISEKIIEEARRACDALKFKMESEFQSRTKELNRRTQQLEQKEEYLSRHEIFVDRFIRSKISEFPEVADAVADWQALKDEFLAEQLEAKNRPAPTAAEAIRNMKIDKRELIKRNKALEWEMKYLHRLLPWLDEIEDSPIEPVNLTMDYKNPLYNANGVETTDVDNAGYWLTHQEYKELSAVARNQLALDRYKARHKSNMEIGRDYERYIGYLFCTKGFKVEYTGIQNGLNDLGRDLICKHGNMIYIVQCKCWSNIHGKIIREKHINQLYGTAMMYVIEHNKRHPRKKVMLGKTNDLFNRYVVPIFFSTVPFSDTAKDFAKALGIELNQVSYEDYPMIKCNVGSNGERIYHLPFDQMYDKTDMSKKGTFYAMTVAEAEAKGFRRAKRWIGN